ncbi:hypothetical protein A3731_08105 [Roseovarius sp. HI0049]|nr:hypothetical protein A3731_08105 [Roseovarius sp. HI0049]
MFSTLNDSILKLALPQGAGAGPDGMGGPATGRSGKEEFRDVLGSLARAAGREVAAPRGAGTVESSGPDSAKDDEGETAERADDAIADDDMGPDGAAHQPADADIETEDMEEETVRLNDAGERDERFHDNEGHEPGDSIEGAFVREAPLGVDIEDRAGHLPGSVQDDGRYPPLRADGSSVREVTSARAESRWDVLTEDLSGGGSELPMGKDVHKRQGEPGRKSAHPVTELAQVRLPIDAVEAEIGVMRRGAIRGLPAQEEQAPLPTQWNVPEQAAFTRIASQDGTVKRVGQGAETGAPAPRDALPRELQAHRPEQRVATPPGPATQAAGKGFALDADSPPASRLLLPAGPAAGQDRTVPIDGSGRVGESGPVTPAGAALPAETRQAATLSPRVTEDRGGLMRGTDRFIAVGRGGGEPAGRLASGARIDADGAVVAPRPFVISASRPTAPEPLAGVSGHPLADSVPRPERSMHGMARSESDGSDLPAARTGERNDPLGRPRSDHPAGPAPGAASRDITSAHFTGASDQGAEDGGPMVRAARQLADADAFTAPAQMTGSANEKRIKGAEGREIDRLSQRDTPAPRPIDGPTPLAVAGSRPMPASRDISGVGWMSVAHPAFRSSTAEPAMETAVPVHGEPSSSSRPSILTPGAQPPPAPAQSAPPQVMQVSAAIRGSTEGSFDIHLNPAELGKVRISLTPSDTGIMVSVLTDRPETLDLLRRHVDLLAQDFRDIGYESASFSFGGGEQDGPRSERERQAHGRTEAKPGEAQEPAATPKGPGGRLPHTSRVDLRV